MPPSLEGLPSHLPRGAGRGRSQHTGDHPSCREQGQRGALSGHRLHPQGSSPNPPQSDAFRIMTPPGEAPYCSSQKQSLPREINCFVVDGKETGGALLKCSLCSEETEGRLQVTVSSPSAPRGCPTVLGKGVAFLCWVTPARMSQGAADGPRSRPAPCYGAQHGLHVPAPSFTNRAIPVPQFLD